MPFFQIPSTPVAYSISFSTAQAEDAQSVSLKVRVAGKPNNPFFSATIRHMPDFFPALNEKTLWKAVLAIMRSDPEHVPVMFSEEEFFRAYYTGLKKFPQGSRTWVWDAKTDIWEASIWLGEYQDISHSTRSA